MKLGEFITLSLPDLDVGNDFSDEWYTGCRAFDAMIAFCSPCHLTEEGLKEFKSIMNYDVDVSCENRWATVNIPGKTDTVKQRNLNKVMRFFYSAAGYVSEDLYNAWFKEE